MMRIKVEKCPGWRVAVLTELAMACGVLNAGFKAGVFSALFACEHDARKFQRAVLAG